MNCCKDWEKATGQGSEVEGNLCLIRDNGSFAGYRARDLGPINFCPWCGAAKCADLQTMLNAVERLTKDTVNALNSGRDGR